MYPSGRLILDTSCFKHLKDSKTRAAFMANLRIADLVLWPTAVNVLEAAVTPDPRRRAELLEIIRDLRGNRLIFPWPFDLIKRVAYAVLRGESRFQLQATGHENLLDPEALSAAARNKGLRAAMR